MVPKIETKKVLLLADLVTLRQCEIHWKQLKVRKTSGAYNNRYEQTWLQILSLLSTVLIVTKGSQ